MNSRGLLTLDLWISWTEDTRLTSRVSPKHVTFRTSNQLELCNLYALLVVRGLGRELCFSVCLSDSLPVCLTVCLSVYPASVQCEERRSLYNYKAICSVLGSGSWYFYYYY